MASPVQSPLSMSIIMSPPPYHYYYYQQQQQQQQHHHSSPDISAPSLGFPLGTALLLILIFTLSGIFSCCYHCHKFRYLRQSYAAANADLESGGGGGNSSDKAKALFMVNMEEGVQQSMPVIMPGDHIPRFIALPSPCAPLRPEVEDDDGRNNNPDGHHHAPLSPTSSSSVITALPPPPPPP